MVDELRKAQRDYGAAFANVLALAKQCGVDHPTVERLLHALTLGPAAGVSSMNRSRWSLGTAKVERLLEDRLVPDEVDHMQAALQRAALAFRQVVDALHKRGGVAMA